MGMTRKQITFDLSLDALRQHYPHKEEAQDPQFFKRAYKDIQRFMAANGFERGQYSVYVSKSKLTALDVAVLTQNMAEEFPWLRQCVKEITATSVGARHIYGAPTKTQRSGFRGERKKEWSGRSPRRQAGTEQSEISSDEGLLRSDAPPVELLKPSAPGERRKSRDALER